jgi:hypothetical protein
MSWLKLVLMLIALAMVALFMVPVQVCKDCAFVDECTGSRKGYREWFFGAQSGHWYQESSVETFMRTNQPNVFQQRWTSYAGTGKNIFGMKISFGHGRPGYVLWLKPEDINRYCERNGDKAKRHMYDVLSSGNQNAIRELSEQIFETIFRN